MRKSGISPQTSCRCRTAREHIGSTFSRDNSLPNKSLFFKTLTPALGIPVFFCCASQLLALPPTVEAEESMVRVDQSYAKTLELIDEIAEILSRISSESSAEAAIKDLADMQQKMKKLLADFEASGNAAQRAITTSSHFEQFIAKSWRVSGICERLSAVNYYNNQALKEAIQYFLQDGGTAQALCFCIDYNEADDEEYRECEKEILQNLKICEERAEILKSVHDKESAEAAVAMLEANKRKGQAYETRNAHRVHPSQPVDEKIKKKYGAKMKALKGSYSILRIKAQDSNYYGSESFRQALEG